MSSKLKIYKIKAYFVKGKKKINFTFECRALKIENALDRVYSEIGSRHNVTRTQIYIAKKDGFTEIPIEEATNTLFADIDKPDFKIQLNY
ncbi:MAG: 50S ribosomal protein L18Ae [Candidatus Heimdallarchaeota archaeon LC_2]|nr:MAG: 50S ribosomal protein L18Ae [Candidatus Heimdallarchaeota archaeon LC_2]